MTQKEALKIMLAGGNVFLTGAPGAGKTYVLNQFIEQARDKGRGVAVTASTGIAASHLNGTTIHSWSGLGITENVSPDDLERMQYNSKLVKRIKRTDVLVIDEVSMLHGHRLDMVDTVCRHLRKSPMPFGGMQVILVGDLFQLPPVTRDSNDFDFAYLSEAWQNLNLKICYLTEQHRQAGSDLLLVILQAMRQNNVSRLHMAELRARIGKAAAPGEVVTKLYSHNVDVDTINAGHLAALKGKAKIFNMRSQGDNYRVQQLMKSVLAPLQLVLKVDAEVMFVANDFNVGFVNGTRGRVVKFNKAGEPIVRLANGRTIRVEPHSWTIKEDERLIAEVTQVPLRLAWAITIHKSQGMSLDAAEVDLSKAFMPSMGYVALSRVRSLEGLYLVGLNDMALTMHHDIYDLDAALLAASKTLTEVK